MSNTYPPDRMPMNGAVTNTNEIYGHAVFGSTFIFTMMYVVIQKLSPLTVKYTDVIVNVPHMYTLLSKMPFKILLNSV